VNVVRIAYSGRWTPLVISAIKKKQGNSPMTGIGMSMNIFANVGS